MKKNVLAIFIGAVLVGAPMLANGAPTRSMDGMMASCKKMNSALMSVKMTGNTDYDFAAMMVPHHQGAIDMAKLELKYGKDAKLKEMAQAMITGQTKEIADMQAWMKAHPVKGSMKMPVKMPK